MGYLLAISFFLHFISLFIIVVLFQKIHLLTGNDQQQQFEKSKSEIEDLLVAYTTEMKEENEKLLEKLIVKKKDFEKNVEVPKSLNEKRQKTAEGQARSLEDKILENAHIDNTVINIKPKPFVVKQKSVIDTPQIDEDDDQLPYFSLPIDHTNDVIEQSIAGQILSLHNRGYTVNDIAKKLNIGAGEVELQLKFHK